MTTITLGNMDKSGWVTIPFGEIARSISERVEPSQTNLETYVGLEHIDPESIHIKRFGSKADVSGTKLRCYPGDVIFARRRAYQRKAAICEFDGFCSAHSLVLRANPKVIDPQLFPFFLHSDTFMHRAVDISVGSLSPTINWTMLKTQEFLLPPKDQQAKLAELLWAADAGVENLTYAKATLSRLRDATFQTFLDSLDKKHSKKVADILTDGPRNGFSPKTTEDGSSFTVSIGAVSNGRFRADGNLKRATVDTETLEKFDVCRNDLFIVRGNGNRLLCGKAGLATADHENLFYPDLLIRLRFDTAKIDPEFVAYQWNHPTAHLRLLKKAKSTNGIWKINGSDINSHTLIVPPITEQSRILGEVRRIEQRLMAVQKTLTSATALKKSLINQIF